MSAQELQERALQCIHDHRIDEADILCRRALTRARRRGDRFEIATLTSTLATVREWQWKLSAAEKLHQRVFDLLKGRAGNAKVNAMRASALTGLGRIARVQAQYDRAERFLRRAVALSERSDTAGSALAASLSELGILFRYTERAAEAIALYKRAMKITKGLHGNGDPLVAAIYHMLAGAEHTRGRVAKAEEYARESVRIRTAALGADHPDVAADVAALAAIVFDAGNAREAERLTQRALALFDKAYRSDHYEVAVNLNNLGSILYARGDKTRAAQLYRRSLTMKEALLGRSHPDLAVTLDNLSLVLEERGDLAEAKRLASRAQRILSRVARA